MRRALWIVLMLPVALVPATGWAQAPSGPLPWERKATDFIRESEADPLAKFRAREERALKKFGLGVATPPQRIPTPQDALSGPPVSDVPDYSALDRNRDGGITRQEYMFGRARPHLTGPVGSARSRAHRARLESRFRNADRNRDGRVSADELRALDNPRF